MRANKRFVLLLGTIVLLGVLAAGCAAESVPDTPEPKLQMKVRVDFDKWPPEVIVELSGPPGRNWVLFQARSQASGEKALRYKGRDPIDLDKEAEEIKHGEFAAKGTVTETRKFELDLQFFKPGGQVSYQAICGTKKGLQGGTIQQKTSAISVQMPKAQPLALKVNKFDAKKQMAVIEVSDKPGSFFRVYMSDSDPAKVAHGHIGGTEIGLGQFLELPLKLEDQVIPGTGTKSITVTLGERYVVPTEVFFQAVVFSDLKAPQRGEFEQTAVVSVTAGVAPPVQPGETATPEQPAPTAPPEQPTEAAPGEWKRPCTFDPNPTEPGGYTYVKEGLQVLDQGHRKEWGDNWCGPTAAGISLGYWAENGYPHLVPDTNKNGKVDEEEKYDIMDELGRKMNTDPDEGTSDDDLVDGLEDFIRQMGSSEHFTVEVYDSDLGTTEPTFADYKRELERCEDVLVGIEWPGGGNWLVGRSVCNVQNPDGTYNVDFVDPGTSRVYHTRMDPVTNKIWYGGQWVTFDIMVVVSPITPPPAPGTCYVGLNNAKPPFDDRRVRQAFGMALDRELLLAYIGGERMPATSFVPPGIWPEERDDYGPVGLPFDRDRARALLNEAGWPTEITLGAPEDMMATAEHVADMWEKNLGIEVQLEPMEWGAYQTQLRADAPQGYLLCWRADYKSPYNFLADVFRSDSANNYAQFHNADYDALLTEAALEADEKRKLELYLEAEEILCYDEAGIIPIYYYTSVSSG